MRVAVVAGFAPSLTVFRGELIRALSRSGNEVAATAPERDLRIAEILGGWNVGYKSISMNRSGLDPLSDCKYMGSLRRWFTEFRPDVILAYTHKPIIFSALAAAPLDFRPRVYALITGLGYAFIGSGLKARASRFALTLLYRQAARHFSGVMFQNPDDQLLFNARRCIRAGTPQLIVRGSGIDLAEFPFSPRQEHVLEPLDYTESTRSKCVKFLLIARLLGDKGIREYVEAARIIKRTEAGVEFHLVGPPDPNPAAISLSEVNSWESEGLVIYHGAKSDVRPYLRDCSVYVLPSYREGTPRTVLEAMATGRAVITTDTPGCRETVFKVDRHSVGAVRQGLNGFLVPVRSVDALVAAMRRLITETDLAVAMGAEGRRLAEEFYDVHNVNREMMKFMDLKAIADDGGSHS